MDINLRFWSEMLLNSTSYHKKLKDQRLCVHKCDALSTFPTLGLVLKGVSQYTLYTLCTMLRYSLMAIPRAVNLRYVKTVLKVGMSHFDCNRRMLHSLSSVRATSLSCQILQSCRISCKCFTFIRGRLFTFTYKDHSLSNIALRSNT